MELLPSLEKRKEVNEVIIPKSKKIKAKRSPRSKLSPSRPKIKANRVASSEKMKVAPALNTQKINAKMLINIPIAEMMELYIFK